MVSIRNVFRNMLLLGAVWCAASQSMPAQARATGRGLPTPSRVDIYATYGYFKPNKSAKINGQLFNDNHDPNGTFGLNYFFTPHWGVNVEAGLFSNTVPAGSAGCSGANCAPHDQTIYTAQAGPVYRLNFGRLVPFLHVTGGAAITRGPAFQPLTTGYGVTGGGGVDYVLPFFGNHVAIRAIQADYQYSHTDYGTAPSGALADSYGVLNMPALKLSGGIVARLGSIEPAHPAGLACEVEPSLVYPGDPVKIDPATVNLNPKKKTKYVWNTTGGTLALAGDGATLDTTNLAPGTYTVHGHLSQGGKQYQQADCSRDFTVRPFDPPTIACSASPSTLLAGDTATINAAGRSPQNRRLTYSFSSNGGQISSQGSNATLKTGNSSGTIVVTCTVVDDLGKSAVATTSVAVSKPTPAPLPLARSLCSVSFERDHKHPVRVDNEAKACLDEVALIMGRESDAKLALIGNYIGDEGSTAGAERSVNVRAYLTQDKGIDSSRIEVYTGTGAGKSVDSILLPPGATNPAIGARKFDPATVRGHGEPYGRRKAVTPTRRKHRRK